MMYFLIANPKWLGLLREEVEGAFHRETLQDHLDTLDRLVVLNAVIQETLRLGMPFSGLPRIVPAEGLSINGHYVPGGTFVSVPIWTHHVDEAYFPNPYNFDPARWISDGKFSSNNGLLLTFGAGALAFHCLRFLDT
jgi:cytochrome P450